MDKHTRDLVDKAKKFKGKIDVIAESIKFEKRITVTCRNDALDLIFLLDNGWNVTTDQPLDALRRFIEALPEGETA